MYDLQKVFEPLDGLPVEQGFRTAIDAAAEYVGFVDSLSSKLAESPELASEKNPYVAALGTLAQAWENPDWKGLPQHPSSLGQVLVLGGLGSLAGYAGGKLLDRAAPNDAVRFSRAGAILGGLLGTVPGLASAYLNHKAGRPVWTSSFWNNPKTGSFMADPYAVAPINVANFQNAMWNDPSIVGQVPISIRAGASGLIQGAANLPGKYRNSNFVTPFEVARVAVGMGSGLASGWLVGKTLGAVFGTGEKTQKLLRNTGMAMGALKTVIPLAYGGEAYSGF